MRIIYSVYLYNYKYSFWKNENIVVKIIDIDSQDEEGIVYNVKLNGDNFLLYIKNKDKIYMYGEKLKIISNNYEIKKYGNPYEFDYKRYLNSKGIISKIYCIKILEEYSFNKDFFSYIYNIRNIISKKLDDNMDKIKSNLLKSIIYGDNSNLDKDLKKKFSDIGLGHILCVSGTHVIFLLSSFDKIIQDKKHKVFKIILLIYFYIISLFNISLLRAICMFILSNLKIKLSFKDKYFLTIIFILIINPYYVFNIGVIFSFLSILGIHVFYNLFNSWFRVKIRKSSNIIEYIINNISLTLSSQVLILPFLVYYFQKITLISIISNLILSIGLNILMFFGFSLFILFFIPIVSKCLIFVCSILLNYIIFQIDIIDSINYLNIKLPKINILIFLSYYTIIIIYLYGKRIRLLSWKNRNLISFIQSFVKYICMFYCIYWYIKTMYFERYVIFFNVGQGNMALIHNHYTNIVVDIGSTKENIAGNILNNFLKAKNINNIDAIFLTHMHNDHINGIYTIMDNINIQRVCFSKPIEKTEEYNNLKSLLKDNNITIINLIEEDNIKINNIIIDILAPPKNEYIKDDDMLNANSNVFLIKTSNSNFLFMGDSTKKTEKYILNKYILHEYGENDKIHDISQRLQKLTAYQVSHHGSSTSSYDKFISNIKKCNAIISADKNVYGHPNEGVLELLKKYGFKINITQKNGAIKF